MLKNAVQWLSASVVIVSCAVGCAVPERPAFYPPPPLPPNTPCDHCSNSSPLPPRYTPTPAEPPLNYYTPPPYSQPSTEGSYVPPRVQLYPPEAVAKEETKVEPPRESAKIAPPQTVEPPLASIPNGSAPLVKNDPQTSPRLPADIPFFAMVKTRVASGQQPLPDGADWLKNASYRTVLHLRDPGDRSTIAKQIFEQRGLHYVSLEVGPQNLTKEVVEQFNKLVTDEANQPLFVYDRDSSLAGALWYLHFRLVDRMPEDKAITEVERLGFRSDRDDNSRKMWVAAQQYLRSVNP